MTRIACCFLVVSTLGIGTARGQLDRSESVTIILKNNDKIKAENLDLQSNNVVFSAKNLKKAYQYGETLHVARIKGIKTSDGKTLSVVEYRNRLRRIQAGQVQPERPVLPVGRAERPSVAPTRTKSHYEEVKNKPISQMTDNEFKYFLLMKAREHHGVSGTVKKADSRPTPTIDLPNLAKSLAQAGVADGYLTYLNSREDQGEELKRSEAQLKELISQQEQQRKLRYVDVRARRALSEAFVYNREDLQDRLDLEFSPDVDMDYQDLIAQLHERIGPRVTRREFRVLSDVFGDSGARAIKQILANYSTWQSLVEQKRSVAATK